MNYLDTYQEISTSSEALGANPIQQIKLLLEKLNQDINAASIATEEKDIQKKCKKIKSANDIVIYLRECLNPDVDPEFVAKLDGMYQHLEQLLFWANAKNDVQKLAEAKIISNNILTWWKNVMASHESS